MREISAISERIMDAEFGVVRHLIQVTDTAVHHLTSVVTRTASWNVKDSTFFTGRFGRERRRRFLALETKF